MSPWARVRFLVSHQQRQKARSFSFRVQRVRRNAGRGCFQKEKEERTKHTIASTDLWQAYSVRFTVVSRDPCPFLAAWL